MLNDILLILVPMSYADLSTARQLACYRIGYVGCDIGPTCFVSHSMSGSDDAWLTLNLSREQSTTFQTGCSYSLQDPLLYDSSGRGAFLFHLSPAATLIAHAVDFCL